MPGPGRRWHSRGAAVLIVLGSVAPGGQGAAAPAPVQTFFAGVASAAGANGTQWRSEAVLANPGAEAAEVLLEIAPRDAADVAAALSLTLAPGETRHLADVYAGLGAPSGAGTLRVTGDALSWVRTFNQTPRGSFGLAVPPVRRETAFGRARPVYFPINTPSDAAKEFRSNLLLLNMDATDVTFTLSAGGTSRTTDVPAGTQVQISGVGGWLGLPGGPAVLSISASGPWFGYVTTIDPATGDPTTVRGLDDSTRSTSVFPGVASASGVNGTLWRSEAILFNPRDAAQTVVLELTPRGESAVSTRTTLSLTSLEARTLGDVYAALGSPSGAGTLRVGGDVLTWVRTFNQGIGATFGTDVPEVLPDRAVGPDAWAAFPVSSTADITTGFRSNLLVYNHEARPVTLTVASQDSSATIDLPAGAFVQKDNVGAWLGLAPGTGTVQISGNGRWSGLVTTIDPYYGDPTGVLSLLSTPNPAPTDVGAPIGAAQSATIGPSGGTLATAGGNVRLTVPAGALAAPTTLTLQERTNLAWGGLGNAVSIGPAGTAFAKPVTLSFAATADDLARASLGALGAAIQDSEGYWSWADDAVRDPAAKTVSLSLSSLTVPAGALAPPGAASAGLATPRLLGPGSPDPIAALIMTAKLVPSEEYVQVREATALEILACYAMGRPPAGMPPAPNRMPPGKRYRGQQCDGRSPQPFYRQGVTTSRWAVEGVEGGDATSGRVVGLTDIAAYQAPVKAPKPRTVYVSTVVHFPDLGDLELGSPITVVGVPQGWLRFESHWDMFPERTFTFESQDMTFYNLRIDSRSGELSWDLIGTVTAKPLEFQDKNDTETMTCTCAQPSILYDSAGHKTAKLTDKLIVNVKSSTMRWVFRQSFLWACPTEDGGVFTWTLNPFFMTRTGTNCTVPQDVPIGDPFAPVGSFTMTCIRAYTVDAAWHFDETDGPGHN